MLRLAKVVAAHPEDHSVDLLMLDTADRIPGVQVLADFAGTDFGSALVVEPDKASESDPWSPRDTNTRDILAVVGKIGASHIVLGFLFPQAAQALFARKNFKVTRHPSDVYTTVDDAGNVEVSHPSGTYLRIGESPDHEDLTGKDFDKLWAIKKNTDKAVHVRLRVANAGVVKATLTISPDGNVSVQSSGSVTLEASGDISLTAGGNINLTATGNLSANATRYDFA